MHDCQGRLHAPEIFGVLLHERTQARTQALPHPENSNANLNPQSPREQKDHFYSFVIGSGKRRGEEGGEGNLGVRQKNDGLWVPS